MTAYILKRLLATIPAIAVVAVLVFMLLRLTPGDPAAILAGDAAFILLILMQWIIGLRKFRIMRLL